MRKLILMIMTAVCAASCFGDGPSYSRSYNLSATFEYGNICGSDSLYFENQLGEGVSWQDLAFYHKLNSDKSEHLGGFVISCLDGNKRSGKDLFRVNKGTGYYGSATYAVFHDSKDASMMPELAVGFMADKIGTCKVIGCYVNNTAAVVDAVKTYFEPGDKLTLNLTGYLGGKKTGTDVIVLAERTQQKDSIITEWKPCLFPSLGYVDCIDMEIVSTKAEVPTYVCIDNLQADISIEY